MMGKIKIYRQKLPHCQFVHHKSALGLNTVLTSGPATNYLSHGTAMIVS
jgi:hypothetical protein